MEVVTFRETLLWPLTDDKTNYSVLNEIAKLSNFREENKIKIRHNRKTQITSKSFSVFTVVKKCYRIIINWFTCSRLISCRYGFMTINILRRKLLSIPRKCKSFKDLCSHLSKLSILILRFCIPLLQIKKPTRRSFEKIKFRKINWIKFSLETLCYLYKNLNLFSFHVLLLFFPFLCYPKLHMKESHWKFI